MRVAAIDVGSNSIHMVIAQVESDGRFTVLDRAKEMVRLGQRSLTSGRLTPEAMTAGLRTLAAFKLLAERQGVVRFNAVATSAVREAKNGGDFVQRVKDEIGLRVKVIPGREEARLIFLGVRHAVDLRGAPAVIVDAGGGSVELILVEADKALALDSVKLGVARLCEQFLSGDRPTPKQLADLDAYVAEQLEPFLARVRKDGVRRVVGTSGTMLNLITVAGFLHGSGPTAHLNNFSVPAEAVMRVRRLVSKAGRDERLRLEGLDNKRVDFIIPAACVADHLLARLGATEMVACTWALREGVLLDFISRHRHGIEEAERFADPRRRSVARLLRHLGDVGPHGANTAKLAMQLFEQLQEDLRLPDEAREWLEYAALMHDVGHHIGHKDHQRHSHYLISNSELLGFRPEEIQMIALTARYHRKAAPKDGDEGYSGLARGDRRVVRALSALLRIADALDRGHYGVVREISISRRGDKLVMGLYTNGDDVELEVWEARRRVGMLEDLMEVAVEFQVHADSGGQDEARATVASI